MKSRNNTCDERKVVLFFYGELEEEAHVDVEKHLISCEKCRQVVQELSILQEMIPAQSEGAINQQVLSSLRHSVIESISEPSHARKSRWIPEGMFLRPGSLVLQLAVVVVLFVTGVFVGRQTAYENGGIRAVDGDIAGEWLHHLLLANRPVEINNGVVDPVIADVHRISFDPNTGHVEVQYSTVNEVVITGKAGDTAVQYMLEKALLNRENPAARLHAVETLEAVGGRHVQPDSALVRALVVLLEEESNEGLRFMALRAIRAMYETESYTDIVKNTLLNILLSDRNQSLRMEALQALSQQPVEEIALPAFMRTILADSNSFIRYRASQILEETQASLPLESPN